MRLVLTCRSVNDRDILYRTFQNLVMMNRDKIPSLQSVTAKNPLTCPQPDLKPFYNDQQERCFGIIDCQDFEKHFLTIDRLD
jgi:hypothetical protein